MAINFRNRQSIERLNKLGDGGEASIHDYKLDTVIKLFRKNIDLDKKEQKVKFFIAIQGQIPSNVIGPQEEVTINGNLAGYVMKKLSGAEDLHMLVKPKFLAAMQFTNKDVLQMVTNIGKDLDKLHKKGILVGDISDYNFQMIGKKNYFIDVDSYGVAKKFSPDAYTELFTCPDAYRQDKTVSFSLENEYYNFALLAFYMLTKIHPFGGTYLPDKKLSTLERMQKKISVLGKYKKDIKIPKMIGSWKWMSPELEESFLQIFEGGQKFDITPKMQELLGNMKYCKVHNLYYYSKYSECPVCNENAKVKAAPVIIKTKPTPGAKGPQLTIIFSGKDKDCIHILDGNQYLTSKREVVHIATGRVFGIPRGKKVEFSDDGKITYIVDNGTIELYNEEGQHMSTIERMNKTNYIIRDKDVFYVDKGNNMVKVSVTANGNMPQYLGQVYRPLFEVSKDGKMFIASLYPKKAIIHTDTYNFEVDYTGWINDYAIKYDPVTHKWLFVYQLSNGKHRTMVFGKNEVEYDDDSIYYNAIPLSNIDFYNNTIYDPDNGKIVGTNIVKGTAKEFSCSVVDESSMLEFNGRGFKIYNRKVIYNFS